MTPRHPRARVTPCDVEKECLGLLEEERKISRQPGSLYLCGFQTSGTVSYCPKRRRFKARESTLKFSESLDKRPDL